ncbi:DNA-binding transcriptional regulator, LysR family [Mameliella alba]|uniref:LysR family transcriptional regulator n=1 Tax=Mameliella alba TaxID=561184 RepID=UPI00087F04D7|nr:LysR family transcriptional regulator [Mameliella alba]OWV41387.1 LysR family transcriptional regulator [Mameliella alba]PTR38936.1 DNA-binding transcriptional LysR family regulator [Mameliella alba]GGF70727.1 LysR family transcriptional regulator [Mameliella alba]SDD48325.1 DNA-binding transcriptional regulator, LysR family [Mameliella alba]
MNVTLRQIRAFLAVAELGRFNLAAGALGLTQAAVSLLIKDLEQELGVRLFDRHTRKVNLTDIGIEFLPQARKAMEDLDLATRSVRERAQLKKGKVVVASSIIFSSTTIPALIARFLDQYPGISVGLRDMPEEEIRPALLRNEADIALGTLLDHDPEIRSQPVSQDRLMLICRADHPLAARQAIGWTDLSDQKLIVLALDNPLRQIVERTMIGVAPYFLPAYDVRFSTTAIGMVAAGLGVSVLPENSMELTSAAGVCSVALSDPIITRDICVMQHKWRSLSPPAERLKEIILAAFPEAAAASRPASDP